jgi:hypothetical protein
MQDAQGLGIQMKISLIWTALVLASALLMRSDALALDADQHRKTLAGVTSVFVVIEELSDELKQAGLATATVCTDAELRLRAAGIRVAPEQEALSSPGAPFLYVHVYGRRNLTQSGIHFGYIGAITLQFLQDVRLDRDLTIRAKATTWSVGESVTGSTVEILRESVRDLVDRFANTYLMANPKR